MNVLLRRGYKTLIKLDQGGQGRVYKSELNGKNVAIKVVHVEDPKNPRLDDDLKRELQIIRNLRHPNCIKVLELFRTRKKVYIIMDFMPNGNIGNLIRKFGPICEWNAKAWFCPVARAILYLHDYAIAHRRFVLEDENGNIIKSETYCGTISYNPPEILRNIPYDPFKCDIWCLGVMLFVMINKIYPFDKSDTKKMYENQMNKDYRLQKSIEDRCSDELKDLIRILLEPKFAERPGIVEVCNHPWFPIVLRESEIIDRSPFFRTMSKFEAKSKFLNPSKRDWIGKS
ncbi:serine/arginine-rich splicing factor 1-like [Sarcoptes scabiei]|nr:serine/arginine-rich splicing factor 1-like [Sarcoptes scabiei]